VRKLSHDEIPRLSPTEMLSVERHPVVLILDNIRSVHNVGSILRSSDATLLRHVWVTGYTARPSHPGIRKTALGSEHTVPWGETDDALGLLAELKLKGYTIAALEITDDSRNVGDLTLSDFPLALVVGNEIMGVSDPLLSHCDLAIEIAQYGSKQSFNVSVAVGIAASSIVERYRTLTT